MNILLSGVVGSRACGLETETSDIDVLGVFAPRTQELLGLQETTETHVQTNPDATFHEARKYCRLALKCNPTILELLWLPFYHRDTQLGRELIGIRDRFLSARGVRTAYLGYATQQFTRLKNRADGSFSADTRKRTAKHARHLRRLLYQGAGLWGHGDLSIEVDNPKAYHEFGQRVADGDIELAAGELAWAERFFDEVKTPLPDAPDTAVAERWLQRVRKEFW